VMLWVLERTQVKTVVTAAARPGPPGAIAAERRAKPKAETDAGGTATELPVDMLQRWSGHVQFSTTAIYADAVGRE
jgi:hypothetical protein